MSASTKTTTTNASGGPILTSLEVIDAIDGTIVKALEAGDLNMYDSEVHDVTENGFQYQIRLCPALNQKQAARVPTPNIAPDHDLAKLVETIVEKDPFLPPFTKILIGEMKAALEEEEEGYYVLLNKYAVVRGHFLLVTKAYQSQSHPLTPPQLLQTYLLLLAASAKGRPYFAFFNCGELSGASQPHKHIQLMPGEPPIVKQARAARLANETRPFVIPKLAYASHIIRLDQSVISAASGEKPDEESLERLTAELAMAFMSLLDELYSAMRAKAAQRSHQDDPSDKEGLENDVDKDVVMNATTDPTATSQGPTVLGSQQKSPAKSGPSTPNYNVIMTLDHIFLFPRSAENFISQEHLGADGTGLKLPVNSMGFGGMLLVKSHEELEKVKKVGIANILKTVGLPPLNEEEMKGHDDVFAEIN